MHIAAQAGITGQHFKFASLAGKNLRVAGINGVGKFHMAAQVVSVLLPEEDRGVPFGVNTVLFQAVFQFHVIQFPDRLAERNGKAIVLLVVIIGKICGIAVEDFRPEGQLAVQEPRIHPGNTGILRFKTDTGVNRETLAAAHERGPVIHVKIGLGDACEQVNAFNRGKCHADIQGPRTFFRHLDIDITVAGPRGSHLGYVHHVKIVQVLEALLGGIQIHGVHGVIGLEGKFLADDVILRAVIPGQADIAYAVGIAFRHMVHDVDLSVTCLGINAHFLNVRTHGGVRIPPGTVITADHRHVVGHFLGGIGIPVVHAQAGNQFLGRKHLGGAEGNLVDLVAAPLGKGNSHRQLLLIAFAGVKIFHLVQLDAQITFITVISHQFRQIVLHLFTVNASGFGNPGQPALLLGFHHLSEILGADVFIAHKVNLDNIGLFSFVNVEDHIHKAGPFRFLVKIGNTYIRISGFLVISAQLGNSAAQGLVAESFPPLQPAFLGEVPVVERGIAAEPHAAQQILGRHFKHHRHAVAGRLHGYCCIAAYQTAFQQPFQVLVDHFRGITGARLRSQQIFQTVFGHGLAGASVPHGNALHRPPLIRLVTGKKPRARPQFPHYLFRSHHGTIGASVKGSFILGQNSRTCYQGKGNTQKNGTNHER